MDSNSSLDLVVVYLALPFTFIVFPLSLVFSVPVISVLYPGPLIEDAELLVVSQVSSLKFCKVKRLLRTVGVFAFLCSWGRGEGEGEWPFLGPLERILTTLAAA